MERNQSKEPERIESDNQQQTSARDPVGRSPSVDGMPSGRRPVRCDGGQDIPDLELLQDSPDLVRKYRADGQLYAYRDGNSHVVVSNGRKPSDKWTKRVPATRRTVDPGEKLWTIPDNWKHRVTISGHRSHTKIYRIPEAEVGVKIRASSKVQLVDAWFKVQDIGHTDVRCAEAPDKQRLMDVIETLETDYSDRCREELDVLRRLEQHFEDFVAEYQSAIEELADEVFWRSYEDRTADAWSIEPWDDCFHVTRELESVIDVDGDLASDVEDILFEEGVISRYPSIELVFEAESSGARGE